MQSDFLSPARVSGRDTIFQKHLLFYLHPHIFWRLPKWLLPPWFFREIFYQPRPVLLKVPSVVPYCLWSSSQGVPHQNLISSTGLTTDEQGDWPGSVVVTRTIFRVKQAQNKIQNSNLVWGLLTETQFPCVEYLPWMLLERSLKDMYKVHLLEYGMCSVKCVIIIVPDSALHLGAHCLTCWLGPVLFVLLS